MKSALEGGTRTKGRGKQHECPICHHLGHHWYKCKNGDPNGIAAMELRGKLSRHSCNHRQSTCNPRHNLDNH